MFSISNIIFILCGIVGLFLSKDFIAGIFVNKAKTEQSQKKIFAKIMPVEVSKVQRYIKVSGNLSYRGFVKVKSEKRGQIKYLTQNQFPKAGEVILKLESSAEEANLIKFTGALNKAKYQLERAKERSRQPGTVAESEMKTYESEYQIALGDKKRAESELQKMTIVAPFDGKVGIYNFSIGSYINESDVICTYVSHEDMIVDFTLSESETLNAYPGKKILVSSNLFGGKLFLNAVIENVDPSTDVTYGIRVRARVNNQDEVSKLSAGSAVTVSIAIDNDEPVPNVTEKALEERSGINYLNVATPSDEGNFIVYKQPVEVQSRINGLAIVSIPRMKNDQPFLYALPEPGVNLDGKKVFPTEDSDLSTMKIKDETEAVVEKNIAEAEHAKSDVAKKIDETASEAENKEVSVG